MLGLRGGAIAGIFLWLGYILQTFGLKYTGAGKSGFITGLYIVLVPLLGAAIFRRWPQTRELLGGLSELQGQPLGLIQEALDRRQDGVHRGTNLVRHS